MKTTYHIQAITPIFSYGADPYKAADKRNNTPEHKGNPEIRPASIRGQLRWWMGMLDYSDAMIGSIFGSTAGENGMASKVLIRVSEIQGDNQLIRLSIPQHSWSKKSCYLPSTHFKLHIQDKRNGLSPSEHDAFDHAVKAWLHFGSLGGRVTRGSGSLQLVQSTHHDSEDRWIQYADSLIREKTTGFKYWILPRSYEFEIDARKVASDTIGGPKPPANATRLSTINNPLGGVGKELRNGTRKTSPLKFKIIKISDTGYKILALWDSRTNWTGNTDNDLHEAIRIHVELNKAIGHELAQAIRIR